MPLLAQTVHWLVPATIATVVGATLFVLCITLVYRLIHSSRQFTHAERMRSLEVGTPLNPPETTNMREKAMHNAFWIAFWLGMGVPGSAFSAASTVTTQMNISLGLIVAVWASAATASVTGVICATVLMIHSARGGAIRDEPRTVAGGTLNHS